MRIAAIYDIHGNLPALEAVLADVSAARADFIVVGGDVFPGPGAVECLERLLRLDRRTYFLHGNGDREVVNERRGGATGTLPARALAAIRANAAQLDHRQEQILASWPDTVTIRLPSLGDVLFCHATPRNDTEIVTAETNDEDFAEALAGTPAAVVVCGHTHKQFDRVVGRTRVVNAGSVGMPFDGPGAAWLLLGPDVELRRTMYDGQ